MGGLVAGGGLLSALAGARPPAAATRESRPRRPRPSPGRGAAGGPGTPSPGRPEAALREPGPADWAALRRSLSTRDLLRPGEAGYARARLLYDPRFDGQRPAGVAYCAHPGDVAACVAFARAHGTPVAARSGGHSYAGWSGGTGLVVDVTRMNSFDVGPGGRTVTVGAGTCLIDFYERLAAHGLAVPGGSCPTVGIAGLTLGGGVGVLSRAYGLSSDNLEAVQLVTADGRTVTCDSSRNSDLLWACRGGGGGNFGVATSFTFRARRLSRLVLFFLRWPWQQAAAVVAAWQSWAPRAPDALWSNLHLEATPGGGAPTVQVGGTYLGGVAGARAQLRRLAALVGAPPSAPFVEETSFLDAMLAEAGCADLPAGQCHLPGQARGGALTRVPSQAKSDFFTRPLPASAIRQLVAAVESMRGVRGARGGVGAVAFDAFGGALNRPPADATAFVHRDSLFLAQYSTSWTPGDDERRVARQRAWLRACYGVAHPHASGQAYQNYVDPDLRDWRAAYYGGNYPRLARVKEAYDPHQVFRFPQGITPAVSR